MWLLGDDIQLTILTQ